MPISKKILDQIASTKAKKDEKKLMVDILQIEDQGSFRYQDDYKKLIKAYIAVHEEEVLK